ncbi:Protein F54E12.2 [Aphelenchoides avenae]|nr:Protein F54E12.2 [Aphelenchus avenae]
MGVGKTLTCLAVVLHGKLHPRSVNENEAGECESDATENEVAVVEPGTNVAEVSRIPSVSTLVVAPKTALPQWKDNVDAHMLPGSLSVYEFYGKNRKISAKDLVRHDVVVTTYQEIVAQVKANGPLAQIRWKRVVLDEANKIKNAETATHQSCRALAGQHRWCVTGTPINNSLEDLYSDDVAKSEEKIAKALMSAYMLQRKKEDVLNLPKKDVVDHRIDLRGAEFAAYEALYGPIREAVHQYILASKGEQMVQWSHIFAMLTRLRQCCVHFSLVADVPEVQNLVNGVKPQYRDIFSPTYESAKMSVLLDQLTASLEEGHKCVVVSQWTEVLDLLERHHVQRLNVECTSITGRVTKADERLQRSKSFNVSEEGPRLMLLSLLAGGTAINLVGATRMFLLDLHWNPFNELQAFDRIHRIGQTKETRIIRLVSENTIENRVLRKQKEKLDLASNVFGRNGKTQESSKQLLKDLFDL